MIACTCEHCGTGFEADPQGGHRLLCGDATSKADVDRCLGDVLPHLMVTDPPYGVDYDPKWRVGLFRPRTGGVPDFGATGLVQNDNLADWGVAWTLFPGDVAYVWHASMLGGEVAAGLGVVGFVLRSQIIWRKGQGILSRSDYHWQHESCWYAVRKGATAHWSGDRKQTTVWDINSSSGWATKTEGPNARTGHSTQKPVECMRRPIENNSSPGQAVYDPFVGSGTTIIAAEMMTRACYAIEINPAYVDVCVERWQKFSGQTAMLDGLTFEQVKAERLKEESKPNGRTRTTADTNAPQNPKRQPRIAQVASGARAHDSL